MTLASCSVDMYSISYSFLAPVVGPGWSVGLCWLIAVLSFSAPVTLILKKCEIPSKSEDEQSEEPALLSQDIELTSQEQFVEGTTQSTDIQSEKLLPIASEQKSDQALEIDRVETTYQVQEIKEQELVIN